VLHIPDRFQSVASDTAYHRTSQKPKLISIGMSVSSSNLVARINALATWPRAFIAGVGGMLGEHAFYRWASMHAIYPTQAAQIGVYAGCFLVPLMACVIGVNPKRWDPTYDWFSDAAKADARRMHIRGLAYLVGTIMGRMLT